MNFDCERALIDCQQWSLGLAGLMLSTWMLGSWGVILSRCLKGRDSEGFNSCVTSAYLDLNRIKPAFTCVQSMLLTAARKHKESRVDAEFCSVYNHLASAEDVFKCCQHQEISSLCVMMLRVVKQWHGLPTPYSSVNVYRHIYMHACTYVCKYVCKHIYIYIYTYIIYVCSYVCVYLHMRSYMQTLISECICLLLHAGLRNICM